MSLALTKLQLLGPREGPNLDPLRPPSRKGPGLLLGLQHSSWAELRIISSVELRLGESSRVLRGSANSGSAVLVPALTPETLSDYSISPF